MIDRQATAHAFHASIYEMTPEECRTEATDGYALHSHGRDHALVDLVTLITEYEPEGNYMGEDGERDAAIDEAIARLTLHLRMARYYGVRARD